MLIRRILNCGIRRRDGPHIGTLDFSELVTLVNIHEEDISEVTDSPVYVHLHCQPASGATDRGSGFDQLVLLRPAMLHLRASCKPPKRCGDVRHEMYTAPNGSQHYFDMTLFEPDNGRERPFRRVMLSYFVPKETAHADSLAKVA